MSVDLDVCRRHLPLPDLLARLSLGEHAKKSARCPFHADTSNSFSVYEQAGRWRWKCFAGCGNGDEVDFLAKHFGLLNADAIRKFAELAGANETVACKSAVATEPSKQRAAKIEQDMGETWRAAVTAFTDEDCRKLATWRGYSVDFCVWLRQRELVGLFKGRIAFPVHDETGRVVGIHYRVKAKVQGERAKWFYEGGCKVRPLLIGDTKTAALVTVFESQWDAFALMDKLGWHKSLAMAGAVVITRGSGNGALVAGLCSPDATLYAFKQNDGAEDDRKAGKWMAEVSEHAGCKVMLVTTPEPHKDPNDWTRAGATVDEIEKAVAAATEASLASAPIAGANAGDAEQTLCGNVESVESEAQDSTIPPIPQGVSQRLILPDAYYPSGSMIGRFVDYCHQQIETPVHFIVAGALTLASVLVHRRVFYQWGGKRIYPNLYQVCVANSGVVRKSDAISIVRDFVTELFPDVLLADFTSHERFVECFAEQPIRAMFYSEGKNLIDLMNCKYGAALAGDMIRLYDCEAISSDFKGDRHKTEGGGSESCMVAKNTFLTVLVSIIPEGWVFPEGNQTNGLMGRFELLHADKRAHDILSEPPVLSEERTRLLNEFQGLLKLNGQMQLSEKARKVFDSIQRDNRRRLDENPSNQIASNLSRMPFTILRVAMLYEVAMSGGLEISCEALEFAHSYVDFCHRCYLHFAGEMQKTRFGKLQDRIVEALRRHGPRMKYSLLLNRISTHGECDARTYREALDTLAERGKVVRPAKGTAINADVELVDRRAGE